MIIDHTTASYRNSSPTDIFAALIYNLNYTYRKKNWIIKSQGKKIFLNRSTESNHLFEPPTQILSQFFL